MPRRASAGARTRARAGTRASASVGIRVGASACLRAGARAVAARCALRAAVLYGLPAVSELFAPCCSIFKTKRHRFFWAAWWSAPPCAAPFRAPDASGGGATSLLEAQAEAEQAAGRPLSRVDPGWARAFNRTMQGQRPWPGAPPGEVARRAEAAPAPPSIWQTLGVERTASPDELKAAYRKKILECHPDQGGDADELRRVLSAYDEALRRLRRPRGRAAS